MGDAEREGKSMIKKTDDSNENRKCSYCWNDNPENGFETRKITWQEMGRLKTGNLLFCKGTECGAYYRVGS